MPQVPQISRISGKFAEAVREPPLPDGRLGANHPPAFGRPLPQEEGGGNFLNPLPVQEEGSGAAAGRWSAKKTMIFLIIFPGKVANEKNVGLLGHLRRMGGFERFYGLPKRAKEGGHVGSHDHLAGAGTPHHPDFREKFRCCSGVGRLRTDLDDPQKNDDLLDHLPRLEKKHGFLGHLHRLGGFGRFYGLRGLVRKGSQEEELAILECFKKRMIALPVSKGGMKNPGFLDRVPVPGFDW